METPHPVLYLVALIFSIVSAPVGAADDDFLDELHSQYESMVCTESLSSCANVGLATCKTIVSEVLSKCPSDQVEPAMAAATDSEEAEERALKVVEAYSSCFTTELLDRMRSRDISEECVASALEESAKRRREAYQAERDAESAK